MKVKLISEPLYSGAHRASIADKKLTISQLMAEMVFEMDSINFKECWIAFFGCAVKWYIEPPSSYYIQRSYYYQKEQ